MQLKLPEFSVLEKDRAYTFAGEVAYELRNFAPQLIASIVVLPNGSGSTERLKTISDIL